MTIKILGGGCSKCKALEAATKEALAGLGVNAESPGTIERSMASGLLVFA